MLTVPQVRDAVGERWDAFLRMLPADPQAWEAPTRLGGWRVRDLVAHTVWGVSMEADALRRRRTGEDGPAEGRTPPEDADHTDLAAAMQAAWEELRGELEQLPDDALEPAVPMPYGVLPLPLVLQVFTMEAGVHADDLAAAVGAPTGLGAHVVAATLHVLEVFLPVFATNAGRDAPLGTSVALHAPGWSLQLRRDGRAWEPAPDGTEPEAAISAGDEEALALFLLGRVPADHPGIELRGDRALAAAFKEHFPGP